MPPSGFVRIRIEASTLESRPVVYLHVDGYRFALAAESASQARRIVVELCAALGLGMESLDG